MAMRFQFCHDSINDAGIKAISTQSGWNTHLLEELTGIFNRSHHTAFFITLPQIPHAIGILEQFRFFLFFLVDPYRWLHNGKRLSMVKAIQSGNLLTNHMGRPVCRNTGCNQAI